MPDTAITPNPFRDIYLGSGKTFEELSEEFGIQRSFIMRLTEGCFPTVPPALLVKFSRLSGLSMPTLRDRYSNYVIRTRWNIAPVGWTLTRSSTVAEWNAYRALLARANKIENTRLNIAALLHLNVNVLANWENGDTAKLPAMLHRVIESIESGVEA